MTYQHARVPAVSRYLSEDYNLVDARPPTPPTPTAPGGRLDRAALPPEAPLLRMPGAAEVGGYDAYESTR